MNPNSSIFTKARMASDHLGVKWFIDKDFSISIARHGVTINNQLKVFKQLRENFRSARTYALKCKNNQGKTLHCFAKSKVSDHYNRTGDFIRFCDWRWVHKARLNLLPVNGIKKDVPLEKLKCRHCPEQFEGLPHVICHCPNNLQKITNRHNLIVDRLTLLTRGRY